MSSSERRRWLAGAALLALGGCGFRVRQTPTMAFHSITLTGFAPRSPLAEALTEALRRSVRVVDTPAQAEVVLQALLDERERSIVASTSAAQVREFQLRLKFNFRASTPAGRELIAPVELLLSRDLSYNESAELAKEQEATELFREMQSDVVAQVMRRLASITI